MIMQGTGILLFYRPPEIEAQHKVLSGNNVSDQLVWDHLLKQTLAITSRTSYPTILYNAERQTGNSFAEKISNAIAEAFDSGFDNLIVLGTDCPSLRTQQINKAADLLHAGKDVVIGPDKRGGVYLLGVNKRAFCKESFLKFHWQTQYLLADIKRSAQSFTYELLHSRLQDINSLKDAIITASCFYAKASWRNIVFNNLFVSNNFFQRVFPLIKSSLSSSSLSLRAPPDVVMAF